MMSRCVFFFNDTATTEIYTLSLHDALPISTGNGFCMYIRRDCLDAVGMLDEEAFPRGYGEENDFCMRATRDGWINLVEDRKSTRLNSSHANISYAVFCLKKKKQYIGQLRHY